MIRITTRTVTLFLAASATTFAAISLVALLLVSATAFAAYPAGPSVAAAQITGKPQNTEIEKRSKKRVPGGSGCDSASDRIEHPECR